MAEAAVQDEICTTYEKWQEVNAVFGQEDLHRYTLHMDYMNHDRCCTQILVNFLDQRIRIYNETDFLLERAFGVKENPDWKDFEEFMEDRCFPRTRFELRKVLKDYGLDSYDPLAIIEKTKGRMAEDHQWLRLIDFSAEEGR